MGQHADVFFYIFLIFTGAAIFASLALFARQSLVIAHIALGVVLGPWGLELVTDTDLVADIAHVGIIFLLFLLGMNLQPSSLLGMLNKSLFVTLISSLLFATLGGLIGLAFGFTLWESLVIGAAATFSSTILGLKLLPTTVLHHRHAGEIMVSILLLQDLLAILLLVVLKGSGGGQQEHSALLEILKLTLSLPLLVLFAWLFSRHVLLRLIGKFDKIQEYIFLMTIGWCLGMAVLADKLGMSYEIGAFIGGVVLASHPISLFIAEHLKPLRDFFLVIFFFSLGASLNLDILSQIFVPALLLGGLMLILKPLVFQRLLTRIGEKPSLSLEMGVRLGQISEFSLLVAVIALDFKVIGEAASNLIQVATIMTFIASSYFIVMRYPTPIALSDELRRD